MEAGKHFFSHTYFTSTSPINKETDTLTRRFDSLKSVDAAYTFVLNPLFFEPIRLMSPIKTAELTATSRLAKRVELQVASLQKLSNERAEWQAQMKKSVISEERQRLARDLHDAVSQQLFAISMMTSAVLEHVPARLMSSSIWQRAAG